MQMSISGGLPRRCGETEIITIPPTATRAARNNSLNTDSAFRRCAGRRRFFCTCRLGRVRIYFFFLTVCTALKSNRSKGCEWKGANVVLITYVKEQVLGLQMELFAYAAPGEQTLTCYLPLCFGRTTTHCVSLPGREEKQNKAKNRNEMCVGGSTISSKHAHQQSHCIPSLWKK